MLTAITVRCYALQYVTNYADGGVYQALSVVVRMGPIMNYPFNARSFFADNETKDLGCGIILWRGLFQSVRPAIGKMVINVDISTGTMYKPGPLIDVCLDFLGRQRNPNILEPNRGFSDRERLRLERFIRGVRILTTNTGAAGNVNREPRSIQRITNAGAADLTFQLREGGQQTVAEHFRRAQNRPLQFPDLPCVEVK